jgi:hypothetical protein
MITECKNPTCTRQASATFCSRECQLAMRTVSKGRHIPDLWVDMDTWWAIERAAESFNMSVRDFVLSRVEEWL